MNNPYRKFILQYYCDEVVGMISQKYSLEYMDALRKFLYSKTYEMLSDDALEMWEFSPLGIFDMWESEQKTGDPRNSVYIMGESLCQKK